MNKTLPQELWSFIWHFLKDYKRFVVPFSILAVITGFWSPINSQLIKYMIDTLNAADLKADPYLIFWPAVFFVVNFEIHNLCWRGMGYLNYRYQPKIKNRIIKETFDYIHRHPHHFFQDNMAGRIANQIDKLADHIERIVHDTIRHLIRVVVLLSIVFASTYFVNPIFFYSIFIWFVIFASVNIRLSKRFVDLSVSHAMSEANVSGNVVDSITNASNVRIFARRQYEVSFVKDKLRATKATFRTKEKFALKLQLFQGFSVTAMLSVMLYFLTQLRIQELVTIGDFALILGLSLEVSFVVWWALEQVDDLNKSMGKCKQSLKALLIPLNVQDKENASLLSVPHGEITFKGVKFHYHGSKSLFKNLSVTIKPGEKVGLVGYSGSGKSTFINLILRIYDINDGEILIDNQNIQDCTQDSLRNSISMISQEPSLFHRSLKDNIRYGKLDATDEQIIEAAKRAHAHEFITKIPEGYDLHVGERGVKLSGGQRQRVAIARAILKDAPILVMDEATSALDSITEHMIQESLEQLMQGKTTLVVAHRLSTLLNMDRILVFSEGKIVQDGTHAELLQQEGLYKTLWSSQVGGFLPEKKE